MKRRSKISRTAALKLGIPIWMASLSLNILSLLMPVTILLIFDRIIPFQSTETLRVLTFALLIGAGMEFALRWTRSVLLTSAAEDVAVARHHHFLEQVLHANPIAFSRDTASTYFDRYTAIGQLREQQSGQNQTLAIDLPFTVLFAAMIGLIGGWLILIPLGASCVVLGFAVIMKRLQWSLFDCRKSLDTRRYAFLSALLSSMPTVKANRMEPQMTRRFEMLEDQTVDVSRRLIQFSGFAQSFGAVFSQMIVAAMGLFGAFLVIQNLIGIAELAACMLLNGRIIQPLTKVMSLWVQSESTATSRLKLREMDAVAQHRPDIATSDQMKGEVRVQDVCLSATSDNKSASYPLDFHASSGTYVLVDADKSWMVNSLFEAISGQQAPCQGQILIDGEDAQRTIKRGRGGIVTLEPNPAMLSGKVIENLSAFGDGDAVADAKQIAAALGLDRRVHRLPEGYNTPLGTRSSFEKDPVNRHLIALTRALALRPVVLLMHEPTSVLDTPERQALAECLQNLSPRPTLVVASPDPRIRQIADLSVQMRVQVSPDVLSWDEDARLESTETQAKQRGVA